MPEVNNLKTFLLIFLGGMVAGIVVPYAMGVLTPLENQLFAIGGTH